MIQEDYVSFEVAKLLKEKGFDEATNRYYNAQYDEIRTVSDTFMTHWNNEEHMKRLMMEGALAIPTLQMACRWLRDVHNIHIGINPISGKGYNATIYDVADFDDYGIISDTEFFFHPEEAVEAALKYTLENLI